MQISPDNELVFSGPADQVVLYEVQGLFRRDSPFRDISFTEYALAMQEDLQQRTGLDAYVGPVTPEQLKAHIADSETDFLRDNGRSSGAGEDAEPGYAAFMRRVAVCGEDVTYVLPPRWMSVIAVGSIILSSMLRTRQDDLWELMMDSPTIGVARQIDQEATAIAAELGVEPLSPGKAYELDTKLAQERFDIVTHAQHILITLAKHFTPQPD